MNEESTPPTLECPECGSKDISVIFSVREVWRINLEEGTLSDQTTSYPADDGEDVFFCSDCDTNIVDKAFVAALTEMCG